MIYITYRDLKVKDGKRITFHYNSGGGVNFQRWNLTPFIILDFTCYDFEYKIDKVTYV